MLGFFKGKENTYTIYKNNDQIFTTSVNKDEDRHINIIYEMVGSVDVTSDYDVTIYSIPPNKRIAQITCKVVTMILPVLYPIVRNS